MFNLQNRLLKSITLALGLNPLEIVLTLGDRNFLDLETKEGACGRTE